MSIKQYGFIICTLKRNVIVVQLYLTFYDDDDISFGLNNQEGII